MVNIPERNTAEATLQDSEARFRTIAENFPGVIFQRVTYPDGRMEYQYISPSFERVFGVPRQWMEQVRTPDDLANFIEPEDHRAALAKLRQAEAELTPVELGGRIRGADGQIRWLRSISRPTPQPDGSVLWDGVMLDVTEQRQAEQQLDQRTRQLAAAKQRLEALVRNSSEIVWTVDAEGIPDEDSPSRRAFTGETRDEWMAGGCYDAIHPDDREETARLWIEGKRTKAPFTSDYRLRHKSGEWRWMRVHRVPLLSDEGTLTGWIGMSKDITEEKKAKEQLELLNSELAHRVKNLLAIIIAIAQESGNRAVRIDQFVADFRSRLEALAHSHDLLVRSSWQAVDLAQLLRSQLQMFDAEANAGRIELAGPPLRLNPRAAQSLGMVFHELATNAVKYGALSDSRGRIDVSWGVDETERFHITWKERGGPPVRTPDHTGFGSVVMTKLIAHALEGQAETDFAGGGLLWTLRAPCRSVLEANASQSEPSLVDGGRVLPDRLAHGRRAGQRQ